MNRARFVPLQRVWGWKVAAYLFGAGAGAGAYVLGSGALLFSAGPAGPGVLAMGLGLLLVAGSIPFLIWDLERPRMFLRVLTRVRRSWVARGAWILIAFTALGLLTLGLGTKPGTLSAQPSGLAEFMLLVSLAAGVLVAVYTGLLIGTMFSRPLWNSPAIPALFLLSALSTGAAAVILAGYLLGGLIPKYEIESFAERLRPYHILLLSGELLMIYFHLNISYGRARSSVESLVSGPLTGLFWGLVVAVGLAVPIILEVYRLNGGGLGFELLGHASVLAGGFGLRRMLLLAGTRAQIENLGTPFVVRPEC